MGLFLFKNLFLFAEMGHILYCEKQIVVLHIKYLSNDNYHNDDSKKAHCEGVLAFKFVGQESICK